MKRTKKILSLALCFTLLLNSVLPSAQVFANTQVTPEEVISEEQLQELATQEQQESIESKEHIIKDISKKIINLIALENSMDEIFELLFSSDYTYEVLEELKTQEKLQLLYEQMSSEQTYKFKLYLKYAYVDKIVSFEKNVELEDAKELEKAIILYAEALKSIDDKQKKETEPIQLTEELKKQYEDEAKEYYFNLFKETNEIEEQEEIKGFEDYLSYIQEKTDVKIEDFIKEMDSLTFDSDESYTESLVKLKAYLYKVLGFNEESTAILLEYEDSKKEEIKIDSKEESDNVIITGFEDFDVKGYDPYRTIYITNSQRETAKHLLPVSLDVKTSKGSVITIPVTWKAVDDIVNTEYNMYAYELVLPDGYELSSELKEAYDSYKIALPFVMVEVTRDGAYEEAESEFPLSKIKDKWKDMSDDELNEYLANNSDSNLFKFLQTLSGNDLEILLSKDTILLNDLNVETGDVENPEIVTVKYYEYLLNGLSVTPTTTQARYGAYSTTTGYCFMEYKDSTYGVSRIYKVNFTLSAANNTTTATTFTVSSTLYSSSGSLSGFTGFDNISFSKAFTTTKSSSTTANVGGAGPYTTSWGSVIYESAKKEIFVINPQNVYKPAGTSATYSAPTKYNRFLYAMYNWMGDGDIYGAAYTPDGLSGSQALDSLQAQIHMNNVGIREVGTSQSIGHNTLVYSASHPQYSVTYNANGGTGAPAKWTYYYGAPGSHYLSSTIPTRTGYTFQGWSLQSNATTASYTAGNFWSTLNNSHYTLYAVWKGTPDPLYVYLNADEDYLPEGYRRLLYLESTGTQWIDTGYKPASENLKYELYFEQDPGFGMKSGTSLFGSEDNSGSARQWSLVAYGGAGTFSHYAGNSSSFAAVTTAGGVRHNYQVRANNGTLTTYIDQVETRATYSGSLLKKWNIYLGANNIQGTAAEIAWIKMYRFKIWDNDVLVRDMVPVQNPNGELGMYDKVNGQFYGNSGTGTFNSHSYGTTINLPTPMDPWDYNDVTKPGYTFNGWSSVGDGGMNPYVNCNFANGIPSTVAVYNNAYNGNVIHERIATNSTIGDPTGSGYVLKITSKITGVTPGNGGFYNNTQMATGKTYIHKFIAKVPKGLVINHARNSAGDNASDYWLTPHVGTGEWEEYAYATRCGTSGSFSTMGHVYITGATETFDWYLAETKVIDATNIISGKKATFDWGNDMVVYNNSSNGNVVHTRVEDATNPTGTGYSLKIDVKGTTSPGNGGFYHARYPEKGQSYIHHFWAKVPKGIALAPTGNYYNACDDVTWLTPNIGTGEWEEYAYVTNWLGTFPGNSPSFGHIYLYDGTAPFTWYLGYSELYKVSNPSTYIYYDTPGYVEAQWKAVTYGVEYHGNGATSGYTESSSHTYDKAAPLTKNGFSKAGYAFKGWNTSSDGTGTSYADEEEVINLLSSGGHVHLYAQWEESKPEYTATFDANGGSAANPSSITKEAGVALGTLPTTSKTGYTLLGWFDMGSSQTVTIDADTSTNYKNTSLLSNCQPGETYYVTIDSAKLTSGTATQFTIILYDSTDGKTVALQHIPFGDNISVGLTCPSSVASGNKVSLLIYAGKSGSTSGNAVKYTGVHIGTPISSATKMPEQNVKYYAQWAANSYEVKFNGNGSTSGTMSNQKFTYDQAQNLTANAFSRKYTVTYNYNGSGAANTTGTATSTFNGWATTADGAKVYNDKQSVSNLATSGTYNLYANWTLGKVTLPSPTRTGYTFAGWNTKADGSGSVYAAGEEFTATADITLYAQWTVKKYTVLYKANGGTGSDVTQNVTHGSNTSWTTKPASTFSRTGYTLTSWNTKADGTGTKYSVNTSQKNFANLTLYAQWTANTYTVTYKANGGVGSDVTQTITHGSNTSWHSKAEDTFTREGYTFSSWNTNADGSGTYYEADAPQGTFANTTLYAQWTVNSYPLKIDPNGGYRASDNSTDVISVTKNFGATETISERRKTGYTLTGYTMKNTDNGSTSDIGGATFSFNSSTKVGTFVQGSKPITLTAQWTPNTYKVTLDNQGATTAGTPAYWYQYKTTKVIDGETVYYYTNDTCTTPLKGYTITKPTKTGYTFSGYYTGTNGSGTQYVNANGQCINNLYGAVANDTTLYAYWTPNTYKVTLDNQGGTTAGTPAYWYQYKTSKVINSATVYYYTNNTCTTPLTGSKITVPTKTGYKFGGYYTATNGGGTQYINASGGCINNIYSNVAKDTTLYAKWTPNTLTAYYNANGGTVGSADHYIDDANDIRLKSNDAKSSQAWTYNSAKSNGLVDASFYSLTKPGYTFAGWNTKADGSGTTFADSDATIVPTDLNANISNGNCTVTLYAQWTANEYTVSYDANGGSGTMATDKIKYNEPYTAKENAFTPPRGHHFSHWNEKADDSGSSWAGYIGVPWTWTYTKNITLYAQWSPDSYSIEYDANGGSGTMTSHSITYGSTVKIKDNTFTAPTGYQFAGWTTKSDGTNDGHGWFNASTLAGWTGKWSYINGQYGISSNKLKLYAMWKPVTVTVTLNPNGGSGGTESVEATYNSALPDITLPTYKGHIFKGYFADDRQTNLTSSVSKWSSTARVDFKQTGNPWKLTTDGDKERQFKAVITVVDSTIANPPTIQFNDKTLDSSFYKRESITNGWKYTVDFEITQAMVSASGSTPYDTEYRFIDFEGTTTSTTVTVESASVGGYMYYNTNGKGVLVSDFATDSTLYAHWDPKTFTIEYDANGGSGTMTSHSIVYGNTVKIKDNTFTAPTGYHFAGWTSNANGTDDNSGWYNKSTLLGWTGKWLYDNGQYGIANDKLKLYAMWELNEYTATFDANGGTTASPQTITKKYKEAIGTLPTTSRTNYTFNGWFTAANGGTQITSATTMPLNGATYYAQWTQNVASYKVNHYQMGTDGKYPANATSSETLEGAPDENITLADLANSYDGFKYIEGKVGSTTAATTTIKADGSTVINLYYQRDSYTVKASTGTGISGTTGGGTYYWGASVTVNATVANGYSWKNWTGTGVAASNNKEYTFTMPKANVNLTATATANSYTIKYDANGGSGSMADTSHTWGTASSLRKNTFTKEGYTFTGWYISCKGLYAYIDPATDKATYYEEDSIPEGGYKWLVPDAYEQVQYFTNIDNGVVTAHAQWAANSYEVKFNGNGSTNGTMSNQKFTYDQAQNLTANAFSRKYTVTYNYNGSGAANTTGTALSTFNGWATTSSGEKTYNDKQSVSNLATSGTYNLYANWTLGKVTLPSPTRTGYTFAGWNTKADGSGTNYSAGDKYTPTANTTLYAQWTTNSCLITYDLDGGEFYDRYGGSFPITTYPGTIYHNPSSASYEDFIWVDDATKTGYTFMGWKITGMDNATHYYDYDDERAFWRNQTTSTELSVKSNSFKSLRSSSGTVKFTALWEANSYTAKFDANGGTTANPQTIKKKYGEALGTLPTTTRENFTFDGWFTAADGGTKISTSTTMPLNGATYYAHWTQTEAEYKVNHYLMGADGKYSATAESSETLTGSLKGTITLADLSETYEGYKFKEGKVGSTTATTVTIKADGSTVINLYYERDSYTVKTNFGTGISKTSGDGTFYWGSSVTVNATVSNGYTWKNWTGTGVAASNNKVYTFTMPKESVTLTANATPNSYTIKYDANGGSGSMANTTHTYGIASSLPKNTFTKEGYTFKGWHISYNDLYSYVDPATGKATYYKETEIPAGGYKWLVPDEYDKVQYFTNIKDGVVTAHAQWEANTYTVTYDNQGADIQSGTTKSYYKYMSYVTIDGYNYSQFKESTLENVFEDDNIEIPKKTGYTFKGYFTEPNGGGTQYVLHNGQFTNQLYTTIGPHTLYAYWEANTLTVYYNSNTGLVTSETHSKDSSDNILNKASGNKASQVWKYNIPEEYGLINASYYGLEKEGYTFKGWSLNKDGSGTVYDQLDATLVATDFTNAIKNGNANITMYAQWAANSYEVKFNGNGSTNGTMSNQKFTYDQAQNLTANAFSRKYTVTYNYNGSGDANSSVDVPATFNGWATTADGAKVYNDKQSVSNLTTSGTYNLYANWTLGKVTLPSPTREGYTFAGWNTKADGSGTKLTAGGEYTPTANTTLYAQWTANSYEVKFNGNGSTNGTMSNQKFTYDQAQNLTANAFSRKYTVTYNYNGSGDANSSVDVPATFNGWATTADGAKVYNDKQSVSNLTTSGTYNLYANWTLGKVTLPSPTRKGYTFAGWNTKADGSGTKLSAGGEYTPTANTTLYAQWTAKEVTLTLNPNGGTGGTSSVKATYGKSLPNITIPTLKGYTFQGYFADNRKSSLTTNVSKWGTTARIDLSGASNGWNLTTVGDRYRQIQAVVTIVDTTINTAPSVQFNDRWVENKYYTVEPITNGWKYTIDFEITEEMVTASSGTPYDTHFRFIDFEGPTSASTITVVSATLGGSMYYDSTGVGYLASDFETDDTLYASWKPNTYEVKFNGNGSTSGTMNNQKFTYDQAQNLAANTFGKKHTVTYNYNGSGAADTTETATSTFNGWAITADGAKVYNDNQEVINLTTSGTYNLYANWILGKVTLPSPTRTGYTFEGWNTAQDGSGIMYEAKAEYIPTVDTTLYAQWTANVYNLTYDANGGTGAPASQTWTYDGADIVISNVLPSRVGYIFDGWAEDKNAKTPTYLPGDTVESTKWSNNTTLYAVWTPDTYEVTFDGNGADSGSMDIQVIQYGTSTKLTENTFVKKGYTFKEWTTNKDGTGSSYKDGAEVLNLVSGGETITLYAQWTANTYTVIYDGNGHSTGNMQNSTFTYDQEGVLRANTYYKNEHIFIGWNTKKDGSGKSYEDKATVKNLAESGTVTLYAQWKLNAGKLLSLEVGHTDLWNEHREKFNNKVFSLSDRGPEVFWSGEKFIIKGVYQYERNTDLNIDALIKSVEIANKTKLDNSKFIQNFDTYIANEEYMNDIKAQGGKYLLTQETELWDEEMISRWGGNSVHELEFKFTFVDNSTQIVKVKVDNRKPYFALHRKL